MRPWVRRSFPVFMLSVALIGCGEEAGKPGSGKPAADKTTVKTTGEKPSKPKSTASKFTIKQVHKKDLPKVGDLFGPVDGHLSVVVPEGWKMAPRNSEWVARLRLPQGQSYPSILITGGESTIADAQGQLVTQLTKSNLKNYTIGLRQKFKSEGIKPIQDVTAIQIGDYSGVEWVRGGRSGTKKFDRLFIESISAGQKYTLELRALRGTLREYRKAVYAVAAGMKVE